MKSQLNCIVVSLAISLIASLATESADAGKALIGKQSPWFKLDRMTRGTVSRDDLRGHPAVLVVGRSRKSALPCREWVIGLSKRHNHSVSVFQVVIALKPWFLPRFLVRRELKKVTPPAYYHQVLIEWRDGFAKLFDIPEDDTPTVLLLDKSNVMRMMHRGPMTKAAWEKIEAQIGQLL